MYKVLEVAITIAVAVAIVVAALFVLNKKEKYTSLQPYNSVLSEELVIKKPTFNGYPFFGKIKDSAFKGDAVKFVPYLSDSSCNTCHDSSCNTCRNTILPVNYEVDGLFKYISDNIGTLNVTNNSEYKVIGSYGNTNHSNLFKVFGDQTISGIKPEPPFSVIKPLGYIDFILDKFIKYINEKGGSYIQLNKDSVKVNEAGDRFDVSLYVYEFKKNYTTPIDLVFTLKYTSNNYDRDIFITDIQRQARGPENINDTLAPIPENESIGTAGYFEIQNILGLFYPFKTSTQGIVINPGKNFIKSESEGDKLSNTVFQELIARFK